MSDCCNEKQHPDHGKQISRLNRISGQLEGVRRMIGEKRYCPDILLQLKAARSAIRSLEAGVLKTHLESCVVDAFEAKNEKETEEKIVELVELYKRCE
jgi:DNA-binding FrmR family transcriptional regulator